MPPSFPGLTLLYSFLAPSSPFSSSSLACAKKNKIWNFAQFFWGHLEIDMETPQNDFQIYRPINDTWQAVFSLAGDIGGVSLKRALKMQLRGVNLRSVGHSSQKLLPGNDFWTFPHLYPHLNQKRLARYRLWVYKFENRSVGSPYLSPSAPKRTKQNSNFCFFWHRLLLIPSLPLTPIALIVLITNHRCMKLYYEISQRFLGQIATIQHRLIC